MKKIVHFSKGFLPTTILSLAMITFGIVGLFVKGINLGIDFRPGLIEDIAVVPTAIELTYDGTAVVSVETSTQKIDDFQVTASLGYSNGEKSSNVAISVKPLRVAAVVTSALIVVASIATIHIPIVIPF